MDSANELPSGNVVLDDVHSPRWLNGVTVTILGSILISILLLVDYSAVLFAETRREKALELVTPVMRLTQAERVLNSAGYLTLYIDSSPPCLQVSTINEPPLTARLLHRLVPSSAADTWLREKLAAGNRFYIKGDSQGQIATTADGEIAYALVAPATARVTF